MIDRLTRLPKAPRALARRRRSRAAFTLIEATFGIVLVAVLFVAVVQAVGMSTVVQYKAADRARARALASAMLAEVVQKKYASTSTAATYDLLVSGSAAANGGSRLAFDDVDDYHGYADAPPLNSDGTAVPGCAGYARRVRVTRVNPLNLSEAAGFETGVKLITVTVGRGGQTLAQVSGVRADVQ